MSSVPLCISRGENFPVFGLALVVISLEISAPLQALKQPTKETFLFPLLVAYYNRHGACSADNEIATFAPLESRCIASLDSSVFF